MTARSATRLSLRGAVAGLLMGMLAGSVGCGGGRDEVPVSRYQESPMLRERVEAGELPPVEERLPDEPLVVEVPEVGEYGGSLGGGQVIQSDEWRPTR